MLPVAAQLNGNMNNKNSRNEIITALSYISQLGLCVIISFAIWIGIATWLRIKFGLGNYVSVAGVLLGAGSGVMSFVNFCKQIKAQTSRKDETDEK